MVGCELLFAAQRRFSLVSYTLNCVAHFHRPAAGGVLQQESKHHRKQHLHELAADLEKDPQRSLTCSSLVSCSCSRLFTQSIRSVLET